MTDNKVFNFGGDNTCVISGPAEVDASSMTFFDELEYDCWALIKKYMDAFGFDCKTVDGDKDDIDFYAAKEIQETILKLFEDAGVKIRVNAEIHGFEVDDRVVFEEKHVDDEHETTTYYFSAHKEMFGDEFSNAEFVAISVEFPTNSSGLTNASVEICPKINGEYDGWRDISLHYSEIEKLMELAERSLRQGIELLIFNAKKQQNEPPAAQNLTSAMCERENSNRYVKD